MRKLIGKWSGFDQIITELQIKLDTANDECTNLRQQIKEMADDIRNMDQLIWHMSQCGSWEQMRPLFKKLQEPMERRKNNESARINDIMRKELIKTYAPKLENLTPTMKKHLGIADDR